MSVPVSAPPTAGEIWRVIAGVRDPELPFLPLVDLGVVRDIDVAHDRVTVTVAPTYTGCPANEWIARLLRKALTDAGVNTIEIRTQLNPPWTTDWITPHGRALLGQHGIVPPLLTRHHHHDANPVGCPSCGSGEVERVSEFGATPCKSLYKCRACKEPFEAFKCI